MRVAMESLDWSLESHSSHSFGVLYSTVSISSNNSILLSSLFLRTTHSLFYQINLLLLLLVFLCKSKIWSSLRTKELFEEETTTTTTTNNRIYPRNIFIYDLYNKSRWRCSSIQSNPIQSNQSVNHQQRKTDVSTASMSTGLCGVVMTHSNHYDYCNHYFFSFWSEPGDKDFPQQWSLEENSHHYHHHRCCCGYSQYFVLRCFVTRSGCWNCWFFW